MHYQAYLTKRILHGAPPLLPKSTFPIKDEPGFPQRQSEVRMLQLYGALLSALLSGETPRQGFYHVLLDLNHHLLFMMLDAVYI